jgi:nitroreductase
MNPKLEMLFSRRSIRQYDPCCRPVPEALIQDILEAGMAAPSARNTCPWRIIVVTRRELLAAMGEVLPNGQALLAQVPVALLVCGDLEAACEGKESYLLQDCAALTENMLLAASALGLGACWIGIHPWEQRITPMRQLFALPERIVPFAGMVIGWPAETKEPRTRLNPDFIHHESWN